MAKRAGALALLFLLGGWCFGGVASAQVRAAIGIGDQSAAAFSDPRFAWLGIRDVRLVVPYDVVRSRRELAEARAWLEAARSRRLDVLVTFSHSSQRPRLLPSLGAYATDVALFRRQFPWVREYVTWDEENHSSQPTFRHPGQAARYYRSLASMCRGCTVVAADVLDQPGMVGWLRQFRHHAPGARLWGLHNYFDVNRGGHGRNTRLMLQAVPGDIWFTETGGLVWRYQRGHGFIVRGEAYAQRAAQRLVALLRLSPRIRRAYYYHWRARQTLTSARRHPGSVSWDSGLIRPDCSPRAALSVIAGILGRNPHRTPRAVRNRAGSCVAPAARRRAGA